ncbi:MAG: anaerobic sulfatase maturase, partial [Chloroflexota bacterium]
MIPNVPPSAFHIMTKPRGAVCNLNCRYCYFLKKESLYPDSSFRMSDEILETYTKQYIEAQSVPEVTFAWQGGEPTLMGLEFFQRAVALQKKYRKPGMRIHNALQTNGTILDDTWCQFFKQNNFLIGLSLDGPQQMHDAYRVDKGGKPTFDKVMLGMTLLEKHRVECNILTTVHAANADKPLETYRFLRDEVGAQFIQFVPIVERKNQSGFQEGFKVTRRSVTGKKYGKFLSAVFDEWVRRDVGSVFVQIFDVALGVWSRHPASLCVFAETCGTALALEHNGDLFSCDHYVEPNYLLGNIQEQDMLKMVGGQKQTQFGLDKRDTLPQYCQQCEVRFICNGGCPKNRIRRTPGGEAGLNYLCEGYKAFFNHIDEPMKLMAKLLQM